MSTDADILNLEERIKEKGDEIRRMKADGMDKASLAPHVEELLALKAKLEPPVKELETKEVKATQQKNNKGGKKQSPPPKKEADMSESELRLARLAKVESMRNEGVEPYAYSYKPTHTAKELQDLYEGKLEGGEEDETANVAVAGRIMAKRVFGKLSFFTLQDESGTIQLQMEKRRLGDAFKVRFDACMDNVIECTHCKQGRLNFGTYCYI
jgi:Lysyl-tRNA synthetase (class II)